MPTSRRRATVAAALSAAAAAAAAIAAVSPARAATIAFQEDVSPVGAYDMEAAFVRSDNTTFDTDVVYIAGRTIAPATLRGLFSISVSAIPDGATINSVTFQIVQDAADSGTSTTAATFNLEQLAGGFDESTTNTFASQPALSAGPVVYSSLVVNPEAAGGTTYTFPSTSAFVSAVQAASDANGAVNFALKLDAAAEAASTRNVLFYRSDESLTAASHPLLTIDFTPVPEPASLGLIGLAAACGLRRRRRTA